MGVEKTLIVNCVYSRTTYGEATFRIDHPRCTRQTVGVLLLHPLPHEEDRRIQRLPICAEHLKMRGTPEYPHRYEPL